jgi:hypothetical protein
VPTGTLRVATRELTVIDMMALPGKSGGYGNVATILGELGVLDGSSLAALARPRGRGLIRRVGWLVERFGQCAESFGQAQRAIVSGDVAALAAIASGASQRRAQAAVNSHGEL